MIQTSYSSTSLLSKSVLSNAVTPYFRTCPPVWLFSAASSLATSPLRSEAFHLTSSSVVDATSFFSPIDAVDVRVSRDGGPRRDKRLAGFAAEKEELDIIELPMRVLSALVVEEPRSPGHRRLDDTVERDETRNQQLSHGMRSFLRLL
jgi:hypothetical protein